jgi:lipoate-protein ligase A
MRLLDLTLGDVAADLALDERLFRELERAGDAGADLAEREVLRLWERPDLAVVLGRSGSLAEDVAADECRRASVPVVRRASGGGTALLGPGCLCFSLVLSYARWPAFRGVEAGLRGVASRLAAALAIPGVAVRGHGDLALAERKVSGAAQLRGRHGLLHQGTLLHSLEPDLLSRFLAEPRRRPEYRGRRRHSEFVTNLPLPGPELRARLARAWTVWTDPY